MTNDTSDIPWYETQMTEDAIENSPIVGRTGMGRTTMLTGWVTSWSQTYDDGFLEVTDSAGNDDQPERQSEGGDL